MYCPMCEEDVEISSTMSPSSSSCRICGSSLINKINTPFTSNTIVDTSLTSIPTTMREFLWGDFFQRIEQELEGATTKQLSNAYLNTLGKLIVDNKMLILYDLYIKIESLKIMVVPAQFISLSSLQSVHGNLVLSDPIYGEKSPLNNSDEVQDNIVYMKRGEVSFITKAYTAQENGAKLLIVGQTYDIWPFMMTDTTNQLSPDNSIQSLHIPIVMISKTHSQYIDDIFNKVKMENRTITCELCVGEKQLQCPICCDNFLIEDEVLKLPCRHLFHSICIFKWLNMHTSCPMCRHEMSNSTNMKPIEAIRRGRTSDETSHNQSYFV